MQILRSALNQLVGGFPSQATRTIEMLSNTNQQFFTLLTNLITGEQTQQLSGKCLDGGLATLNTLAIRYKSKSQIKQLLTMQEIYCCLMKVLKCNKIMLENKKIISPALTEYLQTSYLTHKQILNIKYCLQENDCTQQSLLVVLDAISNSKLLTKPILIECIVQIFQLCMYQICSYLSVINTQYKSNNNQITFHNKNQLQIRQLAVSLKRLKYSVHILYKIFVSIFSNIGQPYQYEALTYLIKNQNLADILIRVIEWECQFEGDVKYKFIWFDSIQVPMTGSKIFSFDINNLKQKCFQIISSILEKVDANYNLSHCQNKLMKYIPTLCTNVLNQIILLSQKFQQLNQQYLIASLCDSMIGFLAHTLKFNDLLYVFGHNVNLGGIVGAIMQFLKIRDTDISASDQQYFTQFLEGFCGDSNYLQISRYSVSFFIRQCCRKFDSFPAYFFQTCFHSILHKIDQRLQKRESAQNFYEHLYTKSNLTQQIQTIAQNVSISSCLLGLIILEDKLNRKDFKSVLIDFYLVMELTHFQQDEIAMLYFILCRNINLFFDEDMMNGADRLITQSIKTAARGQKCAISCFQFIKQLYLNFLVRIPSSHKFSKKYIWVLENLWGYLISIFSVTEFCQSQYFIQILCDIVNAEHICSINMIQAESRIKQGSKNVIKQKQLNYLLNRYENPTKISLKMQTIGDYILTKKQTFILPILQKSCQKEYQLIKQQKSHKQILLLRLHQLILQCLQSINWINRLQPQQQTFDIQFITVQFKEYIKYPTAMIKNIMSLANNSEYKIQIPIEQIVSLVQLLSILVSQERMINPHIRPSQSEIDQQLFQMLLPVNLQHPFGQPWLICLCQFTHRINGRYKLFEFDKIISLILETYTQHSHDQLKLNQINLFSLVLLNYQQPQNWLKVHENLRVYFIKLLKIQAEESKIERKKNMVRVGYDSQKIFGITVIRMFHVYLFGFRMESVNQLFAEVLDYYSWFIEKYTVIQATHLILSFKASYKYLSNQNFNKLLDITILILNKLLLNENYYGNESAQECRIRRLSYKIGCLAADPYQQFRLLIQQFSNQFHVNFVEQSEYGDRIRNLIKVNTVKGQPRKLYSIKKK